MNMLFSSSNMTSFLLMIIVFLLSSFTTSFGFPGFNFGWGGGSGGGDGSFGGGSSGSFGGGGGSFGGGPSGSFGGGPSGSFGGGSSGSFGGGSSGSSGGGSSGSFGGGSGGGSSGSFGGGSPGYRALSPEFYSFSCPQANDIVMSILEQVIAKEPRMAASLLRLHFHDCFVQGCDASVLLDDTAMFSSEKNAGPNVNSIRGFEVIDEIKSKLEEACPQTVSCADILALAARGSTVLSGGPNWELPLGRRDATQASLNGANNNLPPPNSTIQNLITFFRRQGLDEVDLVSLSGAHTLGMARCTAFKQRLYNQDGNNLPDSTLEINYYNDLKSICPKSGGDNNISPLDFSSPAKFDNTYFKLIMYGKGLLTSDQVLLTGNLEETMFLVKAFAEDDSLFFDQFAKSMIKMGNISPLIGNNGEVRKNCRAPN